MFQYVIIGALALIALAAVAFPVLAGRGRYPDAPTLDQDLARYRAAVAAGTVCPRCRAANPPSSRFCAECGRELEEA